LYYDDTIKKPIKTSCKEKEGYARCRGIGLDIVNLIYDANNKSQYFSDNINYQGYDEQLGKIKDQLSVFNINSWYNNSYWSTLSLAKSTLNYDMSAFSFSQTPAWEEKNFNAVLGSWVNFQLPLPNIKARAVDDNIGGLKAAAKCNKYSYIEPNLGMVKELKAQGKMLLGMLSALKFTEENAYIGNILKDLNANFEEIDKIVIKELRGEELSEQECNFITRIATQFTITSEKKKSTEEKNITIDLKSTKQNMTETVDGVKLLAAINKSGDDNVILFGPVFNYKE